MENNVDTRISDGLKMVALDKDKRFMWLQEKYLAIREKALADLTNETLAPETLELRQKVYNQICEWIDLPYTIIEEGKEASKEEKLEKETHEKEDIPYLGRRY